MKNTLTRKNFLATMAGAGSIILFNSKGTAKTMEPIVTSSAPFHRHFPSQDPALVEEMVLVSHGQTDKVKELLAAHPELAKAAWDWGFGDWETAIGAASHTGSREIAELLMANGARPDIFTFTMLGNLPAVKAMIEDNPAISKIRGPHGITLLAHAKIRMMNKSISDREKQKGQAMIDYLNTIGDADTKALEMTISDAEKKRFVGKFNFGDQPEDHFMVDVDSKGGLYIKRPSQRFERPLLRVEENAFAPMGAPHVKISFELKDAQATALTINDPTLLVKALRQ